MSHFSTRTFDFFRALKVNNEREWFNDHKQDYLDHVKAPMMQFLRDLDPMLRTFAPCYRVVDKGNGGSMFRIYRDARFSKDKTPYKTQASARIWHAEAGRQNTPLFYLHLAPDEVFVAAGIWAPETRVLNRIRRFMINNPNTWRRLTEDQRFRRMFDFGGSSLKRMPRGFEAHEAMAEDLKRKSQVVVARMTESQACGPRFLSSCLTRFERAAPMMDYLCAALDLEF